MIQCSCIYIFLYAFVYFVSSRASGYTYTLDACKGVECRGKCEDGTCVVSCATEPWDQYVQYVYSCIHTAIMYVCSMCVCMYYNIQHPCCVHRVLVIYTYSQ